MRRAVSYEWHLRQIMAARGLFATSDLQPLLAERGIQLSREQVYRLVAQTPQRLSLDVLAALCDILECGPQDLVEVKQVGTQVRKKAAGASRGAAPSGDRRTVIRRPPEA
jgi:DNA-binding Xre family transcriptional regulator